MTTDGQQLLRSVQSSPCWSRLSFIALEMHRTKTVSIQPSYFRQKCKILMKFKGLTWSIKSILKCKVFRYTRNISYGRILVFPLLFSCENS